MDRSNQISSKKLGKHLNSNNNSAYHSNICKFSLSHELIRRSVCCNLWKFASSIYSDVLCLSTEATQPRSIKQGIAHRSQSECPSDNELSVAKRAIRRIHLSHLFHLQFPSGPSVSAPSCVLRTSCPSLSLS